MEKYMKVVKHMKNKFTKSFIYSLCIIFIFSLSACKKNKVPGEERLVTIEYLDQFFVSDDNKNLPYYFAYNRQIDHFEIMSINTSNSDSRKADLIKYEFVQANSIYDDEFYLYVITFEFAYENFLFESFMININNSFSEVIELNMNIIYIENAHSSLIYPLSIPWIADEMISSCSWVILPIEQVRIKSLAIKNAANVEYTVKINSLPMFSNFILYAKEKVYIDVDFKYPTNKPIKNYLYLEIEFYDSNGVENLYRSDIAIFRDRQARVSKMLEIIRNQ